MESHQVLLGKYYPDSLTSSANYYCPRRKIEQRSTSYFKERMMEKGGEKQDSKEEVEAFFNLLEKMLAFSAGDRLWPEEALEELRSL